MPVDFCGTVKLYFEVSMHNIFTYYQMLLLFFNSGLSAAGVFFLVVCVGWDLGKGPGGISAEE